MTIFNNSTYPSVWILVLAAFLAIIALWLYRSELKRRSTSPVLSWVLPLLRALAVWLVVVMLLEPTLAIRHVEGKPSQLIIALDNSQSMLRTDGSDESRFEKSARLLFRSENNPLQRLSDRFNVRVITTNGIEEQTLWTADIKTVTKPEFPKLEELLPTTDAKLPVSVDSRFTERSALGNVIADYPNAAILMFSDGVSNDGTPIPQAAEGRNAEQPPLFFVGLGAESNQPDAKILSATVPEQLDQLDSLAGEVQLDIDPALPATLTIFHHDRQIWSASLTEDERKTQKVLFSYPIKDLLDSTVNDASDSESKIFSERSKLLNFTARIEQGSDDRELRNNDLTFQTWASLLRNRVLIVDSRPRWETRYIRNALDRDPAWQATAISTQDRKGIEEFLNISQNFDLLSEFDLVILGELPAEALPEESQKSLEKYVSRVGGGLILVDGNFGHYQSDTMKTLADLIPVEFSPDESSDASLESLYQASLTDSARNQPTFMLSPANDESTAFDWATLPPIYLQSVVEPKPAAKVLMTGIEESSQTSIPIFVEMRVGAGMVFYSASDQTWKWRFKLADTVHRRLWAQICRSYARKPFLVQSDALSIDVSAELFTNDQAIPVRALLNSDSFPNDRNRLVYAILTNVETQQAQRFQLQPDASVPMLYTGILPSQTPGQFRLSVETSGMTALQQSIAAPVAIKGDSRQEFLATYQDRASMEQASKMTGGYYATPESFDSMLEQIEAISTGKIVRSNFALWKSYWWFVPLITILAAEWFFRKRGGLL